MLDKLKWALTVPVSSVLGYIYLNIASKKKDNPIWPGVISNRKVLIVGTGPSIDRVSHEYYKKFDVIVYINDAISFLDKEKESFFFTTDIGVLKKISKKEYYNNILELKPGRVVVAPIFFQQFLFLDKEMKDKFNFIKPSSVNYILGLSNRSLFFGRVRIPNPPKMWPKQPDDRDFTKWLESEHQVSYFPVIESTSALSAILFCAKYYPENISLIGCDFGGGRAEVLQKHMHCHDENMFSQAIPKFNQIRNFLNSVNISVENDSWKY